MRHFSVFLFILLGFCAVSGEAREMEPEVSIFLSTPADWALQLYQRYLSPAKGTSCPMEPSDSTYARQAIQHSGLVIGALMTADRLHRCGHDLAHYPFITTERGIKYFDPVVPSASDSL